MIIDGKNISYTSMKEKKNLVYVLRLKKKVKIYSLRLGSGGAPDPTRRWWAGALNTWALALLTI
jgi:hypothetical protein